MSACAAGAVLLLAPVSVHAATLTLDLGDASGTLTNAVRLMLIVVGLSLAPTLLLSVTSFTRIVIVLSLVRQAVGVPQLPPSRVVVGLSLFLTAFTMLPVWQRIDHVAVRPLRAGEITELDAIERAAVPVRQFMLAQTREDDLALLVELSQMPRPATPDDVPTLVVVPAFMLSELRTAFQMGALLFLPFLVIDMVVASVLMSMGMMMLPPMTISLPLKLLVFVMVDGWTLVVRSLAGSFAGQV